MQPDQPHPGAARPGTKCAFAPAQPPQRRGGDASLSVFLGLYLLVLAFFILLVSLSTIEERKARAVMESLTATFGDARPSGTSVGPGEGDLALLLERRLTAAFASLVHVAHVETIKPGRLVRAEVPLTEVFVDGSPLRRPAMHPLLDRVVAALSSAPAGAAVAVEVALAANAEAGQERLAPARADAFARELLARGAPPQRLSIALAPTAGGQVWLTFAIDRRAGGGAAAGGGGAP